MVFYTISLVKVVIMYLFYVIGWFSLSIDICGMIFHTFGYDITFIRSNFISCSPNFPNCQCRLVAPSFPTVTQPYFGATITWLISSPYELNSDISEIHKLYYIIIKVLHQFGKKVHDQVHHYAAKLEIVPPNFIDVLWLGHYCTY